MIPKKDRIRGSLIGGAIGDALGYPVEFVRTYENILKKYGQGGITRYDKLHWWREESAQDAKAWISDDTQMTLYTACGLINARENKGLVLPSIKQAYLEWLETQLQDNDSETNECWISYLPDHEAIKQIGEGWVAEEALAIALYCAAKHFDNFENAVVAAVNHGGDSDSTGAITGNILGAAIGYEALPEFYKKDLELHDVIIHVADDLYEGKVSKYH